LTDTDLDDDELYDDEDLDEYEDLRPETTTGRKLLMTFGVLVLVVVVIVAGTGLWVKHQINPGGAPGAEVELTVPSGSSTAAIASLLEGKHVITNSTLFRYWAKWKSVGPFQAGDYTFHEHSSFSTAAAVLKAGPAPPPAKKVTVPEGLTLPEITAKIAEQIPAFNPDKLAEVLASGQLRSVYMPPDVAFLEGFVFPDTYQIAEGEDEAGVLTKMVKQFDAVAAAAGIDQSPTTVGLTPYQVVIVASLVQAEAKIPEDAPKIARVIYNRLDQNIALGIDATLCYVKATKPCSLTKSDLAADGPYNSRLRQGLPPTPIAAPGKVALDAALHPADGDWIYYVLDVSTPTVGDHFFTASAAEFEKKKKECQDAGQC
jgi:UPF0755 protein